jgi:putative membrane protein
MLQPVLTKNDKRARILIFTVSFVVFAAVVALGRYKIPMNDRFDVHIFAKINAVINTMVSILLLVGLMSAKKGKFLRHKRVMIAAMTLSILFLVSYICHHLLSADTKFGGSGIIRYVYFFILITHIFLAATILPFILYTAYRALISEWPQHRSLARITWPIWFYVSVTGVLVYLFISPYYT